MEKSAIRPFRGEGPIPRAPHYYGARKRNSCIYTRNILGDYRRNRNTEKRSAHTYLRQRATYTGRKKQNYHLGEKGFVGGSTSKRNRSQTRGTRAFYYFHPPTIRKYTAWLSSLKDNVTCTKTL